MNNSMNTQAALYPIREVSRLTGVNAITLRAWERRYDLIEPVRTDSGHRLFTQVHVDRINAAVKLTEQGIPISQVKRFLDEQTESTTEVESRDDYEYGSAIIKAAQSFELERLHAELDSVFSELDDEAVNLVLRQVSLKIEAQFPKSMAFWESALLPRLHVRLRNVTRNQSLSYTKRIWLQNSQQNRSELFVLLVGLHFASQGWYPLIQARGEFNPKALFESIQTMKCQAIAVIDDSGAIDEGFWSGWVQSYPSLDFYYFVNQDEVDALSQQLSAHFESLRFNFN